MNETDTMALAQRAMPQLKKGAFLTVRASEAINTMTIGWAAFGYCWKRPVLMVAVRDSRHTYGIMEQAADFTVSVPDPAMQKALAYCGSHSGRDEDKLAACDLKTVETGKTVSPVIDTAGIHFVCRIIHKAPMDPALAADELTDLYPQKDYHTLYFGEILDGYER